MRSKGYIEEQYRQKFNSSVFGTVLAIGVNVCIAAFCQFNGLKYIYPPPEERTMIIDFEEQKAPQIKIKRKGREPSAENADRSKKLELVQKSEAQYKGSKQNLAKEATVGPDGDVEVPEPPREEEIDNRALFHSAKNTDKDTLAAQTARDISDRLKAGHAEGNADKAAVEGAPSARVKGRSTVGVPPRPSYGVQKEGTVVVDIWVDQNGAVVRAVPGAAGTTVTDKELWNAARQAALKAKFNTDWEAKEQQQGTITYIFKLTGH